MHQGLLPFGEEKARERTIDEKFADYHRDNPEVYDELYRLAKQLRDRGHKRYGLKGLFEVLRYCRAVDARPGDKFKLNNIYTSRYARLIIERDPSFGEGFFELRELKSKETED